MPIAQRKNIIFAEGDGDDREGTSICGGLRDTCRCGRGAEQPGMASRWRASAAPFVVSSGPRRRNRQPAAPSRSFLEHPDDGGPRRRGGESSDFRSESARRLASAMTSAAARATAARHCPVRSFESASAHRPAATRNSRASTDESVLLLPRPGIRMRRLPASSASLRSRNICRSGASTHQTAPSLDLTSDAALPPPHSSSRLRHPHTGRRRAAAARGSHALPPPLRRRCPRLSSLLRCAGAKIGEPRL